MSMESLLLVGDNPVSTCQQCGSTGQDWCTYKDKYAGGEGPFMCLKDGVADVAFMRSIDVDYLTRPHYNEAPLYRAEVGITMSTDRRFIRSYCNTPMFVRFDVFFN